VHQLVRLQRVVRRSLHRVTDPVLVAHGRLDGTAHPGDAHVIHQRVGSAARELLWLEHSGHVVPVDRDGLRLAEAIAGVFERLV
jgi:carboxylesterase